MTIARVMEEGPETDGRRPILALQVARADGSGKRGLRVFCGVRERSIPLEVCRTCSGCLTIVEAEEHAKGWVCCAPPEGVRPSPERLSVGGALEEGVVAVEEDVLVRDVVPLFVGERVRLVVVVDPKGRISGVLHEVDLLPQIQAHAHAQAVPAAAQLGWARVANSVASALMSPAVAISESVALRDALIEMAAARNQRLVAVDDERRPVGVLVDVQAMHVLRAKRG